MSATTALAARLVRVAPQGVRMLVVTDYTVGASPWIDELAGRLLTDGMQRCSHLQRRPAPGYLHAAEGVGRCLACHLRAGTEQPDRAVCGRCAAAAPTPRKAVAVEVRPWLLFSSLCGPCEVLLLHERDQAAAASRSAGW